MPEPEQETQQVLEPGEAWRGVKAHPVLECVNVQGASRGGGKRSPLSELPGGYNEGSRVHGAFTA